MSTNSQELPKKLQELSQQQETLSKQLAKITYEYNETKSIFDNVLSCIFIDYYNEFSVLRKKALQHDYNIPEIAPTAMFFEMEGITDISEISAVVIGKEFVFFKALLYGNGLHKYYMLSIPTRYYYLSSFDGKNGSDIMQKDVKRINAELDLLDTHDEIVQQQKTEEKEKEMLKILLEKYGDPRN